MQGRGYNQPMCIHLITLAAGISHVANTERLRPLGERIWIRKEKQHLRVIRFLL